MTNKATSTTSAADNVPSFVVPVAIIDSCTEQKKAESEEITDLVEQFLASGGSIDYIDPNVMADPPKKPVSNYGSQPI